MSPGGRDRQVVLSAAHQKAMSMAGGGEEAQGWKSSGVAAGAPCRTSAAGHPAGHRVRPGCGIALGGPARVGAAQHSATEVAWHGTVDTGSELRDSAESTVRRRQQRSRTSH